jgi:hypothetical protein
LRSNLNRLATLGLPIYITEFDINETDDAIQLQNYQIYFPLFWDHPSVQGITLWGYAENSIWKPWAFVIDYRNAPRSAMKWLSGYVAGPSRPVLMSPLGAINLPRNPKLVWRSSPSASSYQVQVSEDSSFTSSAVDISLSDTVLQVNPLRPNTAYYWHVSATNQYGTSDYSLGAGFATGSTVVGIEEAADVPDGFSLHQNYPNPFNPSTNIKFRIANRSAISGSASGGELVRLTIFDALGRTIATLVDEVYPPGVYSVRWDASSHPSGVYYSRLQAGAYLQTRQMVMIK